MNVLYFLYVMVIIAQVSKECYSLIDNTNNNTNKKLEEQVKQLSLKIQRLEKENEYQRKIIKVLHQKTSINFEHCKLHSDNICGPCLCRDDARVLKKYYCDCQNLQPKRDCLEHKQVGRKVDGV